MNAQQQLEAKDITIRNLKKQVEELQQKFDSQRKATAHEALQVVQLRAENEQLKQAAEDVMTEHDAMSHAVLFPPESEKFLVAVKRFVDVLKGAK